MPHGTAHGDACTRNLLVAADRPDLVLIDFGFWGPQPYGFDLGQLLLGEVQLGERPAAALPDDERACLAAYVDGLRAEGCDVDVAAVERSHALEMLLFGALPSLPFELLDAPPTPAAIEIARRARGRGAVRPRPRRCHRPPRAVMMECTPSPEAPCPSS